MTSQEWFAVQRLREGVYLIGEPMHVNSYLITGSRRAVLLDTGMGIRDIRARIRQLTDLPVLVVNSHYHFDHVGGNHLFDDIAIHESGAGRLQERPPAEWFPAYLEFTEAALAQYRVFRDIDEAWFQVLGPEMQMRPLPPSFDRQTWRTMPSVPTQLLHEGDELDLGDRTLRVAHTPGHTQDCICLIDVRHRILFSGDTIDTGPIYAQFDDSSIDDFAVSARRLADGEARQADIILSAHGARYQSYPDLVSRVADGFESVRAGSATFSPAQDCFGTAVKQASFNDFSIVVADSYHPPPQ
ncbi:MAG TPA: MBL fold metallo-hydrolase [Streptosporangiaceae bacterium]|nr:MBL fold metallo-hydrolase [Streptosporangiaceae bacterium]